MKKKVILSVLMTVILTSFAYSFLTSKDQKQNTLSAGYNTTTIVEKFPEDELEAGKSIQKVVQIQNNNSVYCYIRVFLGLDDMDKMDHISFDLNDHWSKQGDYYYYDSILKVGELTEPLFTCVKADDSYMQEELEIIVYEESVQVEHYSNALEAFNGIN